jgi:hypothetical protein
MQPVTAYKATANIGSVTVSTVKVGLRRLLSFHDVCRHRFKLFLFLLMGAGASAHPPSTGCCF